MVKQYLLTYGGIVTGAEQHQALVSFTILLVSVRVSSASLVILYPA